MVTKHAIKKYFFSLLIFIISFQSANQSANAATEKVNKLANMRKVFIATEKLIVAGKIRSENDIPENLKSYSLYPYLELELLKDNIKDEPRDKILTFYKKHYDSPMAKTLNHYWINYLAKKQRWSDLIADYQPNNAVNLKCLYFTALIHTAPEQISAEDINNLWLTGEERPKECNSFFNIGIENNIITQQQIWQRIYLAINNNKPEVVRSLGNYLSSSENEDIKLWLRVNNNPNLINYTNLFDYQNEFHQKIIIHGLKKLATKNIAMSLRIYRELNYKYRFSDTNKYDYYKHVAMRMFITNHDKTDVLLSEIPIEYYDEQLHTAAIKTALKNGNWSLVAKRIEQLPAEMKSEDIWVYWLARAHSELHNEESSRSLYSSIANKINYYGLLACNNLKQLCPIEFAITQPYKADKIALLSIPGVRRAIEFYKLKRYMQARLEWNNVIKSLNEKQRYIAASIASELNWHDRNIIVAAIDQGKINNPNKTSELDQNAYLHLKYPLGYQESIIKYAKKYHLDPAWVFAISRQESAFISDAKSSAGALGLMQLMPTTAQKLARKNNIPYHDKLSLLNETTNISLGSAYLHNMLNDNKGNQILATAAYNAGPGRVRQWMKNSKPVATDVWIELVPFYETRNYLKRVITNTAVYRSRLGSGPMVLSENMPVTLEVSK